MPAIVVVAAELGQAVGQRGGRGGWGSIRAVRRRSRIIRWPAVLRPSRRVSALPPRQAAHPVQDGLRGLDEDRAVVHLGPALDDQCMLAGYGRRGRRTSMGRASPQVRCPSYTPVDAATGEPSASGSTVEPQPCAPPPVPGDVPITSLRRSGSTWENAGQRSAQSSVDNCFSDNAVRNAGQLLDLLNSADVSVARAG